MNPLKWTRAEISIYAEYAEAKEKLNKARQLKRTSPQNLFIDEAVSHWAMKCKRLAKQIEQGESQNVHTS